jgi:hypothetical protein
MLPFGSDEDTPPGSNPRRARGRRRFGKGTSRTASPSHCRSSRIPPGSRMQRKNGRPRGEGLRARHRGSSNRRRARLHARSPD